MATGHTLTITDTLGRTIYFNYGIDQNLSSISQNWNGGTHEWARFEYGQVYVAPNFSGLLVNGPNSENATVLTRVVLQNLDAYTFDYNSAFGQVNRINHTAGDGHLMSYTSYNVSSASGQTDCPRFTEQRVWAANWNGDTDWVPATGEEAVTTYSVAPDNSWSQQTMPDGTTIFKEFYYTTANWQLGLTWRSEIWSGASLKKWTTTDWTQDNTGLGYPNNPRVIETNIYDDSGNRKRVAIDYSVAAYAQYGLPYIVREYAADATTILRSTYTDYNLNQAYIDRRIIGLVDTFQVFDHVSGSYVSKTSFSYDWDNATNTYLIDQGAAIRHDNVNYGASFIGGRGNLCAVRRWNVNPNAINDWNQGQWVSYKGYNTNGSVIFTADALGHETRFSYADSFSDGNNGRNTFAYPTTVTDPDNFSSTTQYNYDFGAVTRTEGPPLPGYQQGKVFAMQYDTAGRLTQVASIVGVYFQYWSRRWVYPSSQHYVSQFETFQDGAGEANSGTLFDGAGRNRGGWQELPGSAGGYSGQYIIYDSMGQAVQRSNPTEMNGSWVATGDDAAAGWVWTNQTYDWKGRPILTTNPDGTTRGNTYGGCGCAGGEVTTMRDERGRQRRLTNDVLGRLKQVDELNWDGSTYATTTYSYNALDQITNINQGGRTRTFDYDGFSRLWHKMTPEQGTSTYTYYANDQVLTATDARTATTTFGYNNRSLPTSITYGVPAGVAATANVSFSYDAAGNRISMTDGLGSVSYGYDQLSRLTSETRIFTGLGSFGLTYQYNVGDEVTNITNAWGAQIIYNYNKAGQPTSIAGAGYANSYVSSISYRAFGGLKQMSYANGRTLSLQYDNRLRPTQWNIPGVMGWNYVYSDFFENSHRVTYAQNINDATLDREYDYDNVGRLFEAHTGDEARKARLVPPQGGQQDGPYSHSYRYDQWGNMWYRVGWGGWFGSGGLNESVNFDTHNRFISSPTTTMDYDAAGNLRSDAYQSYLYDATGQQTYASGTGLTQSYDGNGLRVKKVENGGVLYYLRSTVLGGQIVAEITSTPSWYRGYVYLGGQLIALQNGGVYSVHQDLITKSQRLTDSAGTVTSIVDLDPWGGETYRSSSQAFQPHRYTTYERDANSGDEAMMRRYTGKWHRFDQPDPYDGSYDLTNPQSFNRYAYTQNDPANAIDPSGLEMTSDVCSAAFSAYDGGWDAGGSGYSGTPADSGLYIMGGYRDLPGRTGDAVRAHDERVGNAWAGYGYLTNAEVFGGGATSAHTTLCINGTCWEAGGVMWIGAMSIFYGGQDSHDEHVAHDPDDFKQFNIGVGITPIKIVGVNISITRDNYHNWYFSAAASLGISLPVTASIVTGQTYSGGQHVREESQVRSILSGPSGNFTFCPVFPCTAASWNTHPALWLLHVPYPTGGSTVTGGLGLPELSAGQQATAWLFKY